METKMLDALNAAVKRERKRGITSQQENAFVTGYISAWQTYSMALWKERERRHNDERQTAARAERTTKS